MENSRIPVYSRKFQKVILPGFSDLRNFLVTLSERDFRHFYDFRLSTFDFRLSTFDFRRSRTHQPHLSIFYPRVGAMAPETSVPWNELQSKVPYPAFASFFTKNYPLITDKMEVCVTVKYRKKGSNGAPYEFTFTPVASSTNGCVKGPLLEFCLQLYSLFGSSDWTYFNKFCLRFKGIVDSAILDKETEELELALRQRKLKQQEADAVAAIHSNVFNNSLTMEDPFDNAGGSDDERTMLTAIDNSSRKQRRGSCEPQASSGSGKKRRGSCEPQDSGSAGSARVKRRRDESSGSDSSGSDSSGSESRKKKKSEKKKRKAPKTSFAAQAFGAASMFGVKKE